MTATLNRILVCVDFDTAAEAAVGLAGTLAEALHARLTVFHAAAADVPAYFTTAQVGSLEAERRQAQAALTAEIKALAARYTDAPLTVRTGERPAADAILRQASGFDLIVLGTNRVRGLRRWWLGSVAEAVVRAARVPVLVVPAGRVATRTHLEHLLVVGIEGPPGDEVVAALQGGLTATVARTPSFAGCTADRLHGVGLVVVPLGAEGVDLETAIHALEDCPHPLLFLPAAAGVREGVRHDR
jgi:nucleotide-binding universal stress UspA family protein